MPDLPIRLLTIYFAPDTDISGRGTVRSIEPCPPISDGRGNVVTGRFTTLGVSNLADVILSDGSKITGTHSHPVWVPAAQAWVPIKDLRQGMFLDSQHGSVFVVSIELHSLPQDVYNIEVHGEHVYRVGDAAILVHNNNPLCDEYWDLKTRKSNGETVDEARLAELERLVAPGRIAEIRTGKWGAGSYPGGAAQSLFDHFKRHGTQVGAKDVDQYLRKAEAFAQNLKGATKHTVEGATEGVTRYIKKGRYIDLDRLGNIISFGSI